MIGTSYDTTGAGVIGEGVTGSIFVHRGSAPALPRPFLHIWKQSPTKMLRSRATPIASHA